MLESFLLRLRRLSRRLVTRVILIAALSLVSLLVATVFGRFIPDWLGDYFTTKSLDTILVTLASVMLTVTTFSLSVLTSSLQNTASSISHRGTFIMRTDTTVHGVLATFVGAFLFSLIGIVLRATPLMGEKESVVLFMFTMVVVLLLVWSIIRWINHIEDLGALDSTLGGLQRRANTTLKMYSENPALGAVPADAVAISRSAEAPAAVSPRDGYVQVFYMDGLQKKAEQLNATLTLAVQPGDYVTKGAPLIHVRPKSDTGAGDSDALDRDAIADLTEEIVIGNIRNFDQDPRFCISVISEIASRALSPGVNDPQTAIDVIHRLGALLKRVAPLAAQNDTDAPEAQARFPDLRLAPVSTETLYRLSIDAIAHYAADAPEVNAAIDETLAMLAGASGPAGQRAAKQRLSARGRG